MMKSKKIRLVLSVVLAISFSLKPMIEGPGFEERINISGSEGLRGDTFPEKTLGEKEQQRLRQQEVTQDALALKAMQQGTHVLSKRLPGTTLPILDEVDEQLVAGSDRPDTTSGVTLDQLRAIKKQSETEIKFNEPVMKKPLDRVMQWVRNKLTARVVTKVVADTKVKADVQAIYSDDVKKQKALVKQIVEGFRSGESATWLLEFVIREKADLNRNDLIQLINDVRTVLIKSGLRTNAMKKNNNGDWIQGKIQETDFGGIPKETTLLESTNDQADADAQRPLIARTAAKKQAERKAEELKIARETLARDLNRQTVAIEDLIAKQSVLLQANPALNERIKKLWVALTRSAVQILDAQKESLNSLDDLTDVVFEQKFKEYGSIKREIEKFINDAIDKKAEEDAAKKIASDLVPKIIHSSVAELVAQAKKEARLKALEDSEKAAEAVRLEAREKKAKDAAVARYNKSFEMMALRKRLAAEKEEAEALKKASEALIKQQKKAEAERLAALAKKNTVKQTKPKPATFGPDISPENPLPVTPVSAAPVKTGLAAGWDQVKTGAQKAVEVVKVKAKQLGGSLNDTFQKAAEALDKQTEGSETEDEETE
jgi:hypothetical protein